MCVLCLEWRTPFHKPPQLTTTSGYREGVRKVKIRWSVKPNKPCPVCSVRDVGTCEVEFE